jgi:hypothetical protein
MIQKLDKECSCCGAIYVVAFRVSDEPIDWPEESKNGDSDTDYDNYPEYCPFCGSHEADSADDILDEEET